MKKNNFLIFLFCFCCTVFTVLSCEDVIETNLSSEEVIITAPSDSITAPRGSVNFIWEELNGAVQYQFQVASPRFDSVVSFIEDSTLNNPFISLSLDSGRYQWRVRAKNNTSFSSYKSRTIFID